jgi:undecaprenyl-diphosphatase
MMAIEQWDRALTLWINHPAGSSLLLDKIVSDIAESELLKGGLFMAVYWWLWFEGRIRRRDIVVAVVAAVAAVILSRVMQFTLPFHQRPLLTLGLQFHMPLSVRPSTYNTFSSFPSDTATLFVALSVPLWARSWWLGAATMLWTLVVVCVPRVYLGIHYVSDVLGGILLGIAFMAIVCPLLARTRLPDRIVDFAKAHPAVFYGLAFVLSLELSILFYDLRQFGLDAVRLAKTLLA